MHRACGLRPERLRLAIFVQLQSLLRSAGISRVMTDQPVPLVLMRTRLCNRQHVSATVPKEKRTPLAARAYTPGKARQMKTRLMHVVNAPGRILIGPKKLPGCYARIVAQKDGSGRIESFNIESQTWIPAPESVTFSDVWSAPTVPLLMQASIGEKP